MARVKYCIMLLTLVCLQVAGQTDSLGNKGKQPAQEPYYRNVIKLNPTPMLLFGEVRNVTFSYERLISKDQSVAFQAGYLTFPQIFNDTIAGLISFTSDAKQQGINLAADYRYYPALRNRRPAPDGLYIGGYVSYHGLRFNNTFDILGTSLDQNTDITGNINNVNIGFNLGYQFIFWKRLSVDLLLFGPSLNFTQGKGEIKGNLNPDEIGLISDELVDKLKDRFPLLSEIFNEESLTFKGSRSSFGMGFRYAIQIGFHF